MRKKYLRDNFVVSRFPVIKRKYLLLFYGGRAKHLAALMCVGCLISGCDQNDTEPGLTSGCFEAAPSKILNENLNFLAIPDTVFEYHLVNIGFDSDGRVNGRIAKEDVKSVKRFFTANYDATFYLNPENSVRTLRGIEYFSNLEAYGSTQDLLDSVDFSHNKNLKSLYFATDIAGAIMGVPRDLRLSVRTLKYINLGKNENLRELSIINSSIKELDVSGLPNLETLVLSGNDNLKTIYISHRDQVKPGWITYCSGCSELPHNIIKGTVEYKICKKNN